MSDNANTDGGGNPGGGFSAEYVQNLRQENAQWRTKVRELEGRIHTQTIGTELARRGIKAEASWVQVAEGQSPEAAVEAFAQKYPHLVGKQDDGQDPGGQDPNAPETRQIGGERPPVRTPEVAGPQSNKPGGDHKPLSQRSLDEIKQDPKARKMVAQNYRSLLDGDGHRDVGGSQARPSGHAQTESR